MITYQLENWNSYYPECLPLWREHYAEFEPFHKNQMAMAPEVETYKRLDQLGMLQVIVARDAGKMVGYCLTVIRPHIHYCGTLCGFEDSYFLTNSLRQGLAGYKLLAAAVKAAKSRGVKRVYFMTKEFISVEKLLKRLGMEKCDSVYTMWIGD